MAYRYARWLAGDPLTGEESKEHKKVSQVVRGGRDAMGRGNVRSDMKANQEAFARTGAVRVLARKLVDALDNEEDKLHGCWPAEFVDAWGGTAESEKKTIANRATILARAAAGCIGQAGNCTEHAALCTYLYFPRMDGNPVRIVRLTDGNHIYCETDKWNIDSWTGTVATHRDTAETSNRKSEVYVEFDEDNSYIVKHLAAEELCKKFLEDDLEKQKAEMVGARLGAIHVEPPPLLSHNFRAAVCAAMDVIDQSKGVSLKENLQRFLARNGRENVPDEELDQTVVALNKMLVRNVDISDPEQFEAMLSNGLSKELTSHRERLKEHLLSLGLQDRIDYLKPQPEFGETGLELALLGGHRAAVMFLGTLLNDADLQFTCEQKIDIVKMRTDGPHDVFQFLYAEPGQVYQDLVESLNLPEEQVKALLHGRVG